VVLLQKRGCLGGGKLVLLLVLKRRFEATSVVVMLQSRYFRCIRMMGPV